MNAIANIKTDAKKFGGLKETESLLKETNTQELVIALCGPIGSPIKMVRDAFERSIVSGYGYECNIIKLSEIIKENVKIDIPQSPENKRLEALIAGGNSLRSDFGASILADFAVSKIAINRAEYKLKSKTITHKGRRVCFIIDSIKNQAEMDLLRQVYRELLYVVGVFSPMPQREKNLTAGIKNATAEMVKSLIEKDASSSGYSGQTVSDTFPQSDFFLRVDGGSESALNLKVKRFLDLILGAKIITPTADESAMYAAASAAGNSACLSRQVGAAVASEDGQLLSVGWNDVPKPFGGLYQNDYGQDPAGEKDFRCHNKGGKCFNDEEKDFLAENIIDSLGADLIDGSKREDAIKKIASDTKIKGLIEFSRAVHAEMHAILNALKISGAKVEGGSIYVTTNPCHGCARHIVAAGIANVYYIEPYKKSLATKLHEDSITEVESERDLVRILPYDGVAPSRYYSLFKMGNTKRKDGGKVVRIAPNEAVPRSEKSLQSLPVLEAIVVRNLESKGLLSADVESKAVLGGDDGQHTDGA